MTEPDCHDEVQQHLEWWLHDVVVWEGLELWARKQKVFLCLAPQYLGSMWSVVFATTEAICFFQLSCGLPRIIGRAFNGVCS